MTLNRNAITAWVSVTAVTIMARTAAVRTGSGIRLRASGSSTQMLRGAPDPLPVFIVRAHSPPLSD
ncbi:hypothetical protein V1460_22185 [Streptomyces sp. SCSIO 30461]|uniref:hypothetical protein n=1 Tax=Streptomyces sp. SCSIO 30461 TaxID=3118085 RepID=UPI0030D11C28